ncbi:MAG: putative Arylsulfatase [Promethearchaeota archaeon]|nr:MAG: putative Arylsulfatase [Candidatus Lokiarchaeota archaeon]
MILMKEKYNILLIICDQQRRDHLSCYNGGNIPLKTPNIDSIGEKGIRFTNFYCNNPICMPNRSTIFTGQYPSIHGVTTNGRNLSEGTETFAEILRRNGYHTASFGKIHLNYFGAPYGEKYNNPTRSQEFVYEKDYKNLTHRSPYFGLEETKIISGHGTFLGHPDYKKWMIEKLKRNENLQAKLNIKSGSSDKTLERKIKKCFHFIIKECDVEIQVFKHKVPEELYSTNFVKETTIGFLNRFAQGKYKKDNFFCFCSFPDPHAPFTPPGKYFDMYNPEDVPLPETFSDDHHEGIKFFREHFLHSKKTEGTNDKDFPHAKDLTKQEAKKALAAMYGMEKMIDDAVGDILKTLEKLSIAHNTIIIYTTDHGELGGDHRFFFKGPFIYDALIHIPFLMYVPGMSQNSISNSLVSSIDIPETLLEFAGVEIPSYMKGKSMVPIFTDPNVKINPNILIEMDDNYTDQKTRTIVEDEWRMTLSDDFGQLFNLNKDPHEKNNLWDDDEYKDKKLELLLKLCHKMSHNIQHSVQRECDY